MVAKIARDVVEGIIVVLCFGHERVDQVAQVAFVLGLGGEHLAAHFHDVRFRVVADADELDEFEPLRLAQLPQIPRAEFEDDFFRRWVRLPHVGCVAEAERGVAGGGDEGFGEACGRGGGLLVSLVDEWMDGWTDDGEVEDMGLGTHC